MIRRDVQIAQFNPGEYRPLSKQQIERFLSFGTSLERRKEFERNYRGINVFNEKFILARDLILDPERRFWNPRFLADEFYNDTIEVPEEYAGVVQFMKAHLQFLVLQRTVQSPTDESFISPEESKEIIQRELHSRTDLIDLVTDGFPIEVVNELFLNASFAGASAERLDELRGWSARGMFDEYLGLLSGRIQRRELTVPEILTRIPESIFENPEGIRTALVLNALEQRLIKSMTDAESLDAGLAILETTLNNLPDQEQEKRIYLSGIIHRFYDIATFPLRDRFNERIDIKGEPKRFPSFEQRVFSYDFLHSGTKLVVADTGLGKTGAAFLAMENSEASRVLVIAPAIAREAWTIEDSKLFKIPGQTFVVKKISEIELAQNSGAKYVVVGHELLSRAEGDPSLRKLLTNLITKGNFDGAVVDEIDNLRNTSTNATTTVIKLVDLIRTNYAQKNHVDPAVTPIIGLTAKPIRNKLSDLDFPLGLLYPDKYAASRQLSTHDVRPFSETYPRPSQAFAALVSEKRIARWEHAKGVQEFSYTQSPISISP